MVLEFLVIVISVWSSKCKTTYVTASNSGDLLFLILLCNVGSEMFIQFKIIISIQSVILMCLCSRNLSA
jgi:hypothetical protein